MEPLLKKALTWFVEHVVKPVLDLWGQVFWRLPVLVRFLVGGAVIAMLIAGYLFFNGNKRLQNTFSVALANSVEGNSSKALEAIVLSGVSAQASAASNTPKHSEKIRNAVLSPAVQNILAALDKTALSANQLPAQLDYRTTDTGYVTTPKKDRSAYLFIPGFAVRNTDQGDQPLLADSILNPIKNRTDNVLAHDVEVSEAIASSLCALKGETLLASGSDYRIVQTYFLTARGVARICEDVEQPQFDASTFFPTRPYFWPTIKSDKRLKVEKEASKVDTQFFVTEPYLDLGGNGVVLTLCSRLHAMDRAVICIDVRTDDFEDVVRHNFSAFEIENVRISCTRDSPIKCENEDWASLANFVGTSVFNEEQEHLQNRIEELGPERGARLFGQLHVLTSPDVAKGRVTFTVPRTIGEKRISLFLAKFELGRKQDLLWWQAGSLLSLLAIILVGLATYLLRIDQAHSAFKSIGIAMQEVPVPYCRLTPEDVFAETNNAFCQLVGYPLEKLKTMTFRSLLKDVDSQKVYDEITSKRKARDENVPPYTVKLSRAVGAPVAVDVHGGFIPEPLRSLLKTPETFGIVLVRASRS